MTLGGKAVTKGDGAADPESHRDIQGDLLYEIQTSDEAIATDTLAAIPAPGASGAPGASHSAKPSAAASATPSASSAP